MRRFFSVILIISILFVANSISAPVYAQTTSFRFVAWGDTKSDTGVLTRLSPQVKALNPKLTIYAGDLESSGFTSTGMNNWKTAMNGGSANNGLFNITFPVRGNHDGEQSNSSTNWQNYFNEASQVTSVGATNYAALNEDLTYSFDYGNSRFIGIDILGDVTQMSAAQTSWLDQRLTDAESRGLTHAFLFWHGPIYAVAEHCCPTAPSSLITVLNKHQIVSATFHGHEHVETYVHIANNRISSVTHPFEEFVSGDAGAGPDTDRSGRYDYWLNLTGTNSGGFVSVDVSGSNFTVSFYKGGTTTATWTRSFSKGPIQTPTPGGATHTATPRVTLSPTPTPRVSNTPTPIGTLAGDVNGDGVVDIIDFQLLSNSFGKSSGQSGYNAKADFNQDNVVDILDFQILSNNFGRHI